MIKPAVFFTIVSLFAACNKPDNSLDTKLNEKIKSFSKTACAGGTVTRYDFDGSQVYLFDNGCNYADNGFDVTDRWGNRICTLGTIAGNVDCQGKRFETNAKNPVVVYRK